MPQTIAIAEDEPDLLEVLEEYFAAAGFAVIACASAAALRAAVEGRHLHAAILDITMPGEDGLSLARWLRGHGPLGLILATALGRPMDRVVGLDLGADDYVVKPYDLRELLARLRAVLRRKTELADLPAAGLRIGAPPAMPGPRLGLLTLDPDRRVLMGPDAAEVGLSQAEHAVLALLLARRGRIVARDALAEARGEARGDLAGETGAAGLRAADVTVARLRKKIDALSPGAGALIRTVRGEGYVAD